MSSVESAAQRFLPPAACSAFGLVVALSLAGCHGSETADTAPSASAPAATVPAASVPAAARPGGAAPAEPTAKAPDRTTATRSVPALSEAVSALTHTIAGYKGQLGVAILDVDSGELLAAANDRRPLNPASNAKIFTAAAALTMLHGSFRWETG